MTVRTDNVPIALPLHPSPHSTIHVPHAIISHPLPLPSLFVPGLPRTSHLIPVPWMIHVSLLGSSLLCNFSVAMHCSLDIRTHSLWWGAMFSLNEVGRGLILPQLNVSLC